MNYILTNISYTGDMIWQKTFATDTIPFRQIRNRGQKPQYFAENCHPPIVSRDEFQRVQSLMAVRREQFTGRAKPGHPSIVSGSIAENAGPYAA